MCCAVLSRSAVSNSVTPWAVAGQAPLSMGFSRQEYWSGLPCPPPGDLSNPGIKPRSPTLQADSLSSEPQGKSLFPLQLLKMSCSLIPTMGSLACFLLDVSAQTLILLQCLAPFLNTGIRTIAFLHLYGNPGLDPLKFIPNVVVKASYLTGSWEGHLLGWATLTSLARSSPAPHCPSFS